MGTNKITSTLRIDGMAAVTSGAYRQRPWHGHGEIKLTDGTVIGEKRTIDDNPRTTDEILDLAGLAWEPRELFLEDIGFISDRKILVRDHFPTFGKVFELGVHGRNYGVLQNRVGADFIAEILRHRDDAELASATSLFGGKLNFGVVEFRDLVEATRRSGESHDQHTRYMGVYWSHDGSYPLGVKFMNHEWVCENTFTPWNALSGLSVRHTSHAEDRASDAIQAIRSMITTWDEFDREVERLLDIEADTMLLRDAVIPAVIGRRPQPTVNKDGSERDLKGKNWDKARDGIAAEWINYTDMQTAFDAVMAVQGYEQHGTSTRGSNRDVKTITRLLRDDYPLTVKAAKVFAQV